MKTIKATINGRKTVLDIAFIRRLIADNPSWHRTRLSRQLCERWDWRGPNGQLKDMACRNLLLRLAGAGLIVLPAPRGQSNNAFRNRSFGAVAHRTDEMDCELKALLPVQIVPVTQGSADLPLFNCLLSRYHYLGHRNTLGASLKYLVRDGAGRPLACLLFASAAWKTAPRDTFIGWDHATRERNLARIVNHTRFLILPWVRVPHLASHILSRVARRLCADWESKYGHRIYLLETFVDRTRFRGTCYRAANWICVGQTTGRTRNDRTHTVNTTVKDVYIYPLTRSFRRELLR